MTPEDPICPICGSKTRWYEQDTGRFNPPVGVIFTERTQSCERGDWHGRTAFFPWHGYPFYPEIIGPPGGDDDA